MGYTCQTSGTGTRVRHQGSTDARTGWDSDAQELPPRHFRRSACEILVEGMNKVPLRTVNLSSSCSCAPLRLCALCAPGQLA